jgi:hypothetical protein
MKKKSLTAALSNDTSSTKCAYKHARRPRLPTFLCVHPYTLSKTRPISHADSLYGSTWRTTARGMGRRVLRGRWCFDEIWRTVGRKRERRDERKEKRRKRQWMGV